MNRFDAIIEFKPLEKAHLLEIVDLMLADVKAAMREQGIELEVTEAAKEKLAELGYHPAFGARPLRRVIQEHVEDNIADCLLDASSPVRAIRIDAEGDAIVAKIES